MITTVTLNAAIDKTYYLPRFQVGEVSRVGRLMAIPGGKGINVAKVLHQLGERTLASGFVGGNNGQYIQAELQSLGLMTDFVNVAGESRICLNIIDESNQASTELLEPGPTIQDADLQDMRLKVKEQASKSKIIAFSGSLPQGVPSDFYAELIELAKDSGARVLLDTSGEALLMGIEAKPFLIKPNESEIEVIIGKKLEHESDLYGSIKQLMEKGISCVIVSLGERGSIAGYDGKLYRVKAPTINAVNTVGCGDAFIAGIASAMHRDVPLDEAFVFATAVGTANALTEQAGFIHTEDVTELLPKVEIELINF